MVCQQYAATTVLYARQQRVHAVNVFVVKGSDPRYRSAHAGVAARALEREDGVVKGR